MYVLGTYCENQDWKIVSFSQFHFIQSTCAFILFMKQGLIIRDGFLAIAIAVAVIIVYQVVSEIMLLLGKNGTLPPFVAGVLPTAVFATYGIILARKSG